MAWWIATGHRADVGVRYFREQDHPLHSGDDQVSKLVGIHALGQLPHLGRVPAVAGHPLLQAGAAGSQQALSDRQTPSTAFSRPDLTAFTNSV